jgi:acyl-coenzyme A thioesterase 13
MMAEAHDTETPTGFEPLFRTSPFLDMLGPLFYRPTTPGLVIGLRVAPKHANMRGAALMGDYL